MKRYIIIFMLMLSYIGFAEADNTQITQQNNIQLADKSIENSKTLPQEDFNDIKPDYKDLEQKYNFIQEQLKVQNKLNKEHKDKFSALEKSIDATKYNDSKYNKLRELENQVDRINTVNTFNDKEVEKIEKLYKDYLDKIFADNNRILIWVGIIVGSFTALVTILAGGFGIVVPYFMNKRSKKRLREIEENARKEINELRTKIENSEKQAQQSAIKAKVSELLSMAQNEKEYEKAINYCDQAIKLSPNFTSYFYRGNVNYKFKKHNEAIINYNKAVKLNPKYPHVYYNRGIVKFELEKYEEAILDYNEAIKLNPKYPEVYNNRGVAKSKLEKYDEAMLDYNKAISLNPNDYDAYNNKGNIKFRLEKYNEAILDYNKAISLNPNNANGYYNRGIIELKLEKYNEAILDYNKAISLNPNDSKLYINRSHAKVKSRDNRGAILDCNEAIRLDANSYFAYSNRGEACYNLEKYELALEDLDNAESLDSDLPDTYIYKALTLRALAEKESNDAKKAEYIKRAEADEQKAKDLEDKDDSNKKD